MKTWQKINKRINNHFLWSSYESTQQKTNTSKRESIIISCGVLMKTWQKINKRINNHFLWSSYESTQQKTNTSKRESIIISCGVLMKTHDRKLTSVKENQ